MVAGLGAAIAITNSVPIKAQTARNTFLLVHGAWGGGWVWRRVSDLLEKRGYKVFAPTMTGVGERSHLLDAKVKLSTHITDIVNVIKWERIEDVVLVGHSYWHGHYRRSGGHGASNCLDRFP
jgi:pimeloyl-ACP methyl ester carboxylesterase